MTLFDVDKTDKQSMKWNDKLLEMLPEHSQQQSVIFENIKDSLPFETEQQLLNEILFDPQCLSMIDVKKDEKSNIYHFSLSQADDGTDIKSNVSTELILQNIMAINVDGMYLSQIKRYFPMQKLKLSSYNSLIDWFQHRFGAYISFDENTFMTWKNRQQFDQMMDSSNLAEMPQILCKSRENTLNNLLFVDSTSISTLMETQTMSIPSYLNDLRRYINNLSINLSSFPRTIPPNSTDNYDWLYNAFEISYRPSQTSNILKDNNKAVPLKYLTQQILENYQQQMEETTAPIIEKQNESNSEKLSIHNLSCNMPLCLFSSQLYDKLLSFNASLTTYLPLFRNLDYFLKLYGFQITKPSFCPSFDFQMIHIKPSQQEFHSSPMPINVKTLYDQLLNDNPAVNNHQITNQICQDDLKMDPDDIRYILNFCHRDIQIDYKDDKRYFSIRHPLSFPNNHTESSSISSKIYKRESQIDDIGQILQTMKQNEKYMLLSQFINKFIDEYNYMIPIEPLINTLSTESNRFTKPVITELDNGDYFIALDDDSSLGARFESIFIDNDRDSLNMQELKSLWFKKFSQQYPYPQQSLFTLINQFSNKFVLSMDDESISNLDENDISNYSLSLLKPHHKFSFRVKSLLNSLQTHNTDPVSVDNIIKEWNNTYPQTWHDDDTINLFLLPFVSISHPDKYQTKPMIAFDTNFIDIFSDIEGKWNLNMIERLDMMVKQILLSSKTKTCPLSQFQSKFVSFSGYMFPHSINLLESLRQLPSITVDTSSNASLPKSSFSDPIIRLREHVNINEKVESESSALSDINKLFQEKELISMNLSNFNKYYSEIFGKKYFQDLSIIEPYKSTFYQLVKQTYNIWQIDQNIDGYTIDWLITIAKNVHNQAHKTTFYYLTNMISSEIHKSPNKRLYENELPQILPNSTQFKNKYLNNPSQIYPFDQYSNTASFILYNSPQQIGIQYDPDSNQPFFTLRPKKFNTHSPSSSMVSSYISLEEILQDIIANMNADKMRLCEFQTLLFDKLPQTTDWPWIFNKFPNSISQFINVDYSKLDRFITFENMTHLNQKSNNYIKQMNPNDSKLRENIMQQFYKSRKDQLTLQQLSDKLNMKWPILINKIINIFSLDFHVAISKTTSRNQTQDENIVLRDNADNVIIHHPAFAVDDNYDNYNKDTKSYYNSFNAKPIEEGLVSLGLKYKDKNVPIPDIQQTLYALTGGNVLYTSNLMQSLQMLGVGRIKLHSSNTNNRSSKKQNQDNTNFEFEIPSIRIKGWETNFEQHIMNAFVSSLPIENTSQAPYLPYITEESLNSHLASQLIKGGVRNQQSNIFRTLIDTLWADLYTDHCVDGELRFSLKPITKHWNSEEGKQLDALLNHTNEKVMKLSELQHAFYQKHQTFIQGEQSKRALSAFLSKSKKYCVLPLKNGDYLFSFSSYSV